MRLTYILAAIIVATLHASGTAIPAATNPKATTISNGVALSTVDGVQRDGGRILRVEKDAVKDDGIEEERFIKKLSSYVKRWIPEQMLGR